MIFSEGAEWKSRYALFAPGFPSGHLLTLPMMGSIIDDSLIFCKILGEKADAQVMFQMEDAAARVTIDIVGNVVLDHNLASQTSDNELVSAFHFHNLLPQRREHVC